MGSAVAEFRYYGQLLVFRLKEPFTDFRATAITYGLYCFFVYLLAAVWQRFHAGESLFSYEQVFLYVGITELLFMSFLLPRQISGSTEDFALFLARPRSWVGREIAANIGAAAGKRLLFLACLLTFALLLGQLPDQPAGFCLRALFLLCVLALPQALLSTFFSSLRLSFPQTDYFILPFSKLFLSLGGVFGPLSDYGEPWRSIFLQLPGSDLFFQPAYFAVHGSFYQMSATHWMLRLFGINAVLLALVLFFYRRGRAKYQAWGG